MLISVQIANNARRATKVLDDSTTLRQALEDAHVDYSMASPWLDGCALQPGDLDMTFADFGVTDHCQLVSIVKATNALSIKVVDRTCFFESILSPEDLRFLTKNSFEDTILKHEEAGEEVIDFLVGVSLSEGSVTRHGVLYNNVPASNGKARVAVQIPSDAEDIKEYILDAYGDQIRSLAEIEKELPRKLNAAKTAYLDLKDKIQMIEI